MCSVEINVRARRARDNDPLGVFSTCTNMPFQQAPKYWMPHCKLMEKRVPCDIPWYVFFPFGSITRIKSQEYYNMILIIGVPFSKHMLPRVTYIFLLRKINENN
jgi:hypothetical protein